MPFRGPVHVPADPLQVPAEGISRIPERSRGSMAVADAAHGSQHGGKRGAPSANRTRPYLPQRTGGVTAQRVRGRSRQWHPHERRTGKPMRTGVPSMTAAQEPGMGPAVPIRERSVELEFGL